MFSIRMLQRAVAAAAVVFCAMPLGCGGEGREPEVRRQAVEVPPLEGQYCFRASHPAQATSPSECNKTWTLAYTLTNGQAQCGEGCEGVTISYNLLPLDGPYWMGYSNIGRYARHHGWLTTLTYVRAKYNSIVLHFQGLPKTSENMRDFEQTLKHMPLTGHFEYMLDMAEWWKGEFPEDAREWIGEAAVSAIGDAQVELASASHEMGVLNRVLAECHTKSAVLSTTFAGLMVEYASFRASEVDVHAQLEAIASESAVVETFEGMAAVKTDLVALSQAEAARYAAIGAAVNALRTSYLSLRDRCEREIGRHVVFMQRYELSTPELGVDALVALDAVTSYVTERDRRVHDGIERLSIGLTQRTTAVAVKAASVQTRETAEDAALLASSTRFLDGVNAQVAKLWAVAPKTPKLKLLLVETKHGQMVAFLQLEKICSSVLVEWTQAGCNIAKINFSKVRLYLNSTLPFLLKWQVNKLRTAGVDESVLVAIEQDVASGNLSRATRQHDAALRVAEVMP